MASQFKTDLIAAIKKRVTTQLHVLTDGQVESLARDIEQVVSNDSAFAVSQSNSDLAIYPTHPFDRGA